MDIHSIKLYCVPHAAFAPPFTQTNNRRGDVEAARSHRIREIGVRPPDLKSLKQVVTPQR